MGGVFSQEPKIPKNLEEALKSALGDVLKLLLSIDESKLKDSANKTDDDTINKKLHGYVTASDRQLYRIIKSNFYSLLTDASKLQLEHSGEIKELKRYLLSSKYSKDQKLAKFMEKFCSEKNTDNLTRIEVISSKVMSILGQCRELENMVLEFRVRMKGYFSWTMTDILKALGGIVCVIAGVGCMIMPFFVVVDKVLGAALIGGGVNLVIQVCTKFYQARELNELNKNMTVVIDYIEQSTATIKTKAEKLHGGVSVIKARLDLHNGDVSELDEKLLVELCESFEGLWNAILHVLNQNPQATVRITSEVLSCGTSMIISGASMGFAPC